MRRILKWTGLAGLVLVLIGVILVIANRDTVSRLLAVNSLFNEEHIVRNFSSVTELFYNAPISNTGNVTKFEYALQSLPDSFSVKGEKVNTADFLRDTTTTSLVVLKDGRISFEQYYLGTNPDDLRISWSMAKSFLSAAFGRAIADGKIKSLDDEMTEYAPALAASAFDGVTIRNALTMSSGVKFNDDELDFNSDVNKMGRTLAFGGSMDVFAVGITEREREQGAIRQYKSIDAHALAMVLRGATGRSLIEIIGQDIVSAIGFERTPVYLTDGHGVAFAIGGLNATTRDYARFGQMFLDYGVWNGRQVIPREWTIESVTASAPIESARDDNFGYAYQWWVPNYGGKGQHRQGEFFARGIYEQFIYMDRETRTVIVKTSANRRFREPGMEDNVVAFLRTVAGVPEPGGDAPRQ